ncbi:MAG: FAD-binding oxidoreductase [Verrucomicrobiia bacterium]
MVSSPFTFLVQDIIDELPTVRRYRFDYGLTPMEFYAGQFCVVVLPGSSPPLTGALSLATSPLRRESFDLVVKRTGNFGTRFYDSVKAGDVVTMKPPAGTFVLPSNSSQPVILVAFDYCVTAVRAIWQYLEDIQDSRRVHFLHVVRGSEPNLFSNEFSESSSPHRTYLPIALSTGSSSIRVEEIQSRIPDYFQHQLFVVGEGTEVIPLMTELKAVGFPKDFLHVERWS